MFGNTIVMMKKAMDYLWQKQEITSDNIANTDTPGYKKKSVSFEETFKNKLEAASMTGGRDSVRKAIEESHSQVVTSENSVRADGNSVNADVEYMELTRTALQYQYAIQSMNGDITRYRSAIKGQ